MTRITLRIDFDESRALGPGKVRLLELVGQTGSISAAGRAMSMSYRRAWLLVDALNQIFQQPVVQTREGGVSGGGADLTEFRIALVANYRAMEQETRETLARRINQLERSLTPKAPAERPGSEAPSR